MNRDFNSDFELPWTTKLKCARRALAAAVVAAGLIGVIFILALHFLEAALINLGISSTNLLSFSTILSALLVLVVPFFLGFYCAFNQYVLEHMAQLRS